ncbi:TetR/AcrR family transcriptional regulator [Streptomyces spongiae]|uniref:TetR family transcriptional regulator n=1 Tax=Streptomyces spongiae TaxID=565072 RepID=A0A5N8XCA3_9ACTN|nr:TetR family transcriptional regulator [Streptomyces spongiae]MPY56746.1 TetR family transcriptional regulator [Streptomyces spongiae]
MAAKIERGTPASQARRDPEGRRKALVKAAADLLLEVDGEELSHRRVAARAGVPLGATTYYFSNLEELREAALLLLTEWMDEVLRVIAASLDAAADFAAAFAETLHTYLNERDQVQADAALFIAAVRRPALRPLALHWFDGLAGILSAHTDAHTARAVAVFCDGASHHAALRDEPLDLPALHRAVTALMQPYPSTSTKEDPQ